LSNIFQNIDFRINKLNIAKVFFLLFLASLFFPIRYVFPTKDAFQTGAYSDFTSISLYLSDIFLLLSVIFSIPPRGERLLPRGRALHHVVGPIKWLLIWLILGLIWHFRNLSEINWLFFFKYLELIVAYGTTWYLFNKTSIKQQLLSFFLFLSSFQAILAIWQFVTQKSLGLGKVGEQILAPSIIGVAKIVSSGTTFIRGYGTFPHPNLLSAFFVVGILISVYLLVNSSKFYQKVLISLALFVNILGLTVTFSRAGFLALGAGLLTFFIFFIFKHWDTQKNKIIAYLSIIFISCLVSFLVFKPYLQTRTTVSDQASLERIFYAKTAWQMIKSQPIFGVGIGESVIHMQQFSPVKLWPWQIQPVHNYFLLSAAELGIPGMIILIWIFLSHLKKLVVSIKNQVLSGDKKLTNYHILLATLVNFLILMQFDHYFYTLQQTQMLLWIALGIMTSETNFYEKYEKLFK